MFFVASTFGNGGPPTDAKAFEDEVKRAAEGQENEEGEMLGQLR